MVVHHGKPPAEQRDRPLMVTLSAGIKLGAGTTLVVRVAVPAPNEFGKLKQRT